MMTYGTMSGGMGIWMLFGIIFWIVLIAGIVLLVIWAIQRTVGGETSRSVESALEILKKRYARGEISKEKFDEKKRDIL